jgi:hypothetical protein
MIRLISFTSCKTAIIVVCCFLDLNTPQKPKEVKVATSVKAKSFVSECDYDFAKADVLKNILLY